MHNTTLDDENASQHVDDEKYDVRYTRRRQIESLI